MAGVLDDLEQAADCPFCGEPLERTEQSPDGVCVNGHEWWDERSDDRGGPVTQPTSDRTHTHETEGGEPYTHTHERPECTHRWKTCPVHSNEDGSLPNVHIVTDCIYGGAELKDGGTWSHETSKAVWKRVEEGLT